MVIFSGFDEFGAGWGDSETTWEEDYNEMFGWEQYSNDQKMRDKSLREYNGITITTLEKVDW